MPPKARALCAGVVAIVLAACGGSRFGLAPPGAGSYAPAAQHASWMSPEAKSGDLLYVSDDGTNSIDIFSFPGGRMVGQLVGFLAPWGMCADNRGDVFIPNRFAWDVLEFPHGGTKPIAVLGDRHGQPFACAVDPLTGNLAVAERGRNHGANVAIFAHARGPGKIYRGFLDAWSCSYDDAGTLFVNGTYGEQSVIVGFEELRKGAPRLAKITLSRFFQFLGPLQWDGKHLAVASEEFGAGETQAIYRFRISGDHGDQVGKTRLLGAGYIGEFWIAGTRVVVPTESPAGVMFYDYPQGGMPVKAIRGFAVPFGAVVSVAR